MTDREQDGRVRVSEYAKRVMDAYNAGYACGVHGATTENCHFCHFATRELTETWEMGKRQANEELRREAR